MDDIEHKEYLSMLKAQKYALSYKLLMRRTIARIDDTKEVLSEEYSNSIHAELRAQLDEVNAKLFLLGG